MDPNAAAATAAALVARLRAAGCVFAEEEADLLLAETRDPDELESLVRRRVGGEPLEYVLGWAEFAGLRIAVAPGVFVPRPRSGFLVSHAAGMLRPGASVLDLCCGSGALGAALLAGEPALKLTAAELDPAAAACARRNLPERVRVFEGNLFEPLPSKLRHTFDVIVANAPYVPTREIRLLPAEARSFERRTALDGGADGLELHRRIAVEAAGWLAPDGRLLIETSQEQSVIAAKFFAGCGFEPRVVRSEELDATVVEGRLLG